MHVTNDRTPLHHEYEMLAKEKQNAWRNLAVGHPDRSVLRNGKLAAKHRYVDIGKPVRRTHFGRIHIQRGDARHE